MIGQICPKEQLLRKQLLRSSSISSACFLLGKTGGDRAMRRDSGNGDPMTEVADCDRRVLNVSARQACRHQRNAKGG
jgi:hypothetical protein